MRCTPARARNQTKGMRMPVDTCGIGKSVLLGDQGRTFPVNKVRCDLRALVMPADGTGSPVTLDGNRLF